MNRSLIPNDSLYTLSSKLFDNTIVIVDAECVKLTLIWSGKSS